MLCFLPIHSGHQVRWTLSAGVTQEEGHTGFPIRLPSAVRALIFSREGFSHSFPSSTVKSNQYLGCLLCVCVVFSSHPFWTSMDVPAGVTQEEGHTGFLIHLPSAVRALIFVARRIQPFLSLVDREVEFCVLTN